MKFRLLPKMILRKCQRTWNYSTACTPNVSLEFTSNAVSQLPHKEISIPVPWGHIAAKEWGTANGIPILGVHGWQDNLGTFDRLAPLFPETWHFVAIDLAGHGLSSHLPRGMVYDGFSYALQISHVLKYFNWKKFSHVGHSMGGGLGLVFAALYPQMVNHVVSIDLIKLLSLDNTEKYIDTLIQALNKHVNFDEEYKKQPPSYTLEDATKRWVESLKGSLTYESASILLKRGTKPDPNNPDRVIYTRDKRIQLPTLPLITTEFLKKLSTRISTNVMILKAKDGPYYEKQSVYDDYLTTYRKNCKKFEYVEVPGTHHVHLNNPENVASHIINFIHNSNHSSL